MSSREEIFTSGNRTTNLSPPSYNGLGLSRTSWNLSWKLLRTGDQRRQKPIRERSCDSLPGFCRTHETGIEVLGLRRVSSVKFPRLSVKPPRQDLGMSFGSLGTLHPSASLGLSCGLHFSPVFKTVRLQCPSNVVWPFKIYLSQNNSLKHNLNLKMKTSLEVFNIICPLSIVHTKIDQSMLTVS